MFEDSHINFPSDNTGFVPWINERKKTFRYSLERWCDERLCKQPLNCLSRSFIEQKLRGAKNV